MTDEKSSPLVPTLRFPEFREAGEWEELPIGRKVDLLSGYPFKSSEISKDVNGIPLLRGINITEGYIRHSQDIDRFFTGEIDNFAKYRLHENDIVIGMDGSKVGKNAALITTKDTDSLLIQRVARLRTSCLATIQFIFQQINSKKFHLYVDKINTSGGIPHISAKQINEFEIYFPTLPEQQKIASFFTAIDQKLTQLKKKKDLLEQYKKGVLQKIFSQEIRFKDDDLQEFPKWEKKKIKDLIEIKYGKDQKQISCENGKYPILGTGGEMGRTNDFLTDKPSVLIGRKGTIDKPRYMDTPFWTVDTLFYTKVFANTNPKWLYYKFETINWYLYNEASGVPSLSSSTIYTIPIILPTLPEQTKIAGFLSAIDMKISHTQKQIEKAEVWKKGLLQRMFV